MPVTLRDLLAMQAPGVSPIPNGAFAGDVVAGAVPAADKLDTEIANQLMRIAAVGGTPPSPLEAGTPSALAALAGALTWLGRKTRKLTLGTESSGEYLAQHGVSNPTERAVLGFLLDMATDPLSYLSMGTSAAGNLAVKAGVPFLSRATQIAEIPGSAAKLQAAKRFVSTVPGVDKLGQWLSTTYVPGRLAPEEQRALRKAMDMVYSADRQARGLVGKGLEEIKQNIGGTKPFVQPIHNPFTGDIIRNEGELAAFYVEQPQQFHGIVQSLAPDVRARVERTARQFKDLMETLYKLEAESGYDYNQIVGYVSHLWRNSPYEVRRVMDELARVRGITGRSSWPTKSRTIPTLTEGIRYGLTPELDPAKIAALRLMASVKMRVNKVRDEALKAWAETPQGRLMIRKIPPIEGARLPVEAVPEIGIPAGWKPAGAYTPSLGGYIIHPELDRAFRNLDTLLTDKRMLKDFLGTMEKYSAIWKQYVLARPGYHLRNIIGNAVNMALADVPVQEIPGWVILARKVLNAAPEETITVGTKQYLAEDLQKLFTEEGLHGFGGFSEYRSFERELAALSSSKKSNIIQQGINFSQRIGEATETNAKMALFLERLARGMDPHEAANDVRKFLFDYHDLTPVERGLRAVVPFYTWTRRQLPVLLEAVVTKPQLYTALGYATEEAHKAAGVEPSDVPTWLREQMALPVRRPSGRLAMISPGLPIDPLAAIKPGDIPGTVGEFLSMLSPLIRVPVELAANKQLFSGVPITPREFATTPMFGAQVPSTVAYLVNQVPLPFVGSVGQVGRMVPNSPPEQGAGEALPPKPPPTPLQQLVKALGMGGFSFPVNPERQREIYKMLYAKRLQDYVSHLRRDLGQEVPTAKELKRK